MEKTRLDQDEAELLTSYEGGEWRSIEDREARTAEYTEYARAALKKDQRVNIRISRRDLEGIQRRALAEGIPYQTLIASVLHKYVSGRLAEQREDA